MRKYLIIEYLRFFLHFFSESCNYFHVTKIKKY
jgi:hypothetical protein